MLVLSRKLGEAVEIGDNKVIVRVLGIRQSKVQLGVDAPPDVPVHRSEKADLYSGRAPGGTRRSAETSRKKKVDANDRRDRDLVLGESILEDLARVQAEISAMAELVSDQDRLVARQIAAEALERLAAIERTVRFVGRRASEQPIAAFVGSRSRELQQLHADEPVAAESQSEFESRSRNDRCDHPARLIRESNSSFRIEASHCTLS